MTALSRNVTVRPMGTLGPLLALAMAMPLAASTHLYGGAAIALNTSGYVVDASADNSLRVIGWTEDEVDNSAGSAGDLTVVPRRGCRYFANSSTTDAITDADLGRDCYVVDNATVARTSGNGARPVMGRVIGVDDYGVLVQVGLSADGSSDDILILAGADLSAKQFHAVDLTDSSGSAVATSISAAGQRVVGILQNAPASGAVAVIRPLGCGRTSKMIAGGAITSAASLGVTSAGRAKAAVAATVNTSDAGAASDPVVASFSVGLALVSAANNGDTITVLLSALGITPTTAA